MSAADDHWHLDKKVPITIILALFMQFIGGAWFMSKLEARVATLESERHMQQKVDDKQDKAVAEVVRTFREDVQEINRKLDRLIERQK